MNTFNLLSHEVRVTIHDLTMLKHSTGLSPPEEEILLQFEDRELNLPEQNELLRIFLLDNRRVDYEQNHYIGQNRRHVEKWAVW